MKNERSPLKQQRKRTLFLPAALLLAGIMAIAVSCEKDPDLPPPTPPKVVVMFSLDEGEGELVAEVDGKKIKSPAEVERGTEVVFKAVHSKGWIVKHWRINGSIIPSTAPEQKYNISKHTDVHLALKKEEAEKPSE